MEKQLTSAILAQIHNLSCHLEPGLCPRNDTEVCELLQSNRLEETLDKWAEEIRNNARQINIEIAGKLKFIIQVMYSTDAKKTIQLLTKTKHSNAK
jgi:DNA-binding transcriptional regulator YbjK